MRMRRTRIDYSVCVRRKNQCIEEEEMTAGCCETKGIMKSWIARPKVEILRRRNGK